MSQIDKVAMKDCPFCGKNRWDTLHKSDTQLKGHWHENGSVRYVCQECGARGPVVFYKIYDVSEASPSDYEWDAAIRTNEHLAEMELERQVENYRASVNNLVASHLNFLNDMPWERLIVVARRLIGEQVHQGKSAQELYDDYKWLVDNAPKREVPHGA